MKSFSITLSAMIVTVAIAQEPAASEKDETKGAVATPLAETAASNVDDATALQDEGTDEIDLEEDDSAIAAKKPQIKGEMSEGTMSLVDIDCDDATLADILRQFRKTTGANIISDDSTNLQRRVSVSLKHVPWLQGMTAILGSRGFRVEIRDNIYRVVEDLQLIPVSTRTFKLNHASAKELADLFNATYAPKDQNGKIKSPIASSFPGANVVVVTATDKTLSDCEAIIAAVDQAVAQIYIEARFIELSSEAMHRLGMQWNSLESWGASVKNISAGIEYNNGRVGSYGVRTSTGNIQSGMSVSEKSASSTSATTGTTPTGSTSLEGNREFSLSASKGKMLSALTPADLSNALVGGKDMAWRNARGFSGELSVDDFRLALSAFESIGEIKIFSNPKVIVSNGKEATVDMTTKFPNIELASQRNTSASSSYLDMTARLQEIPGDDKGMFSKSCFFSWGIQLSVTPRISPDGLISVEIIPTISQLDKDVTDSGFYQVQNGDNDSSIGLFPIISLKRITTDFTMHDGSTAVIGGLSRTVEDDVDSGIPYLRKIPWIGQKLFGWKSRQKVQKEIIICVTVGIADPKDLPKDVGLPKNAILGREYVRGDKLEPGDREGAAAKVLKLDMTELDRLESEKTQGRVNITPIVKPVPQEALPKATAEEPATTAVKSTKAEEPTKAEGTPALEDPAKEENISELQKLNNELMASDNQ